ncbi:MAG: hypothetical protein AB7I79_17360 [Rhizobiaceae bacterium]
MFYLDKVSGMSWFGIVAGLWGLAMVVVLILAISLSYRIEARSAKLTNRTGIPRRAMLFHTVTNIGVAGDPETQAMRRRMNLLLLVILAGFVLFFIGYRLFGPEAAPSGVV